MNIVLRIKVSSEIIKKKGGGELPGTHESDKLIIFFNTHSDTQSYFLKKLI